MKNTIKKTKNTKYYFKTMLSPVGDLRLVASDKGVGRISPGRNRYVQIR